MATRARKLLEKSDEVVGESGIYGIAQPSPTRSAFAVHDARAVLSTLRSNVEWLRVAINTGVRPAEIIEILDDLEVCAHSFGELLTQRIAASAPSHDDSVPAVVKLSDVIYTSSRHLRRRAESQRVTFEMDIAGEPSTVIDRPLLSRMIDSLLENALRNAPPNSVIEVHAENSCGRSVIRIVDAGEGVTYEELEQVFGGDLALCRSAARVHGGDVYATCEGDGATFVLELPSE